jgi:hypothetical protein
VEDVDHDEKGWIETTRNWRKQCLQGEEVDQMRNGFQKWAVFPGPWQQMNQFEIQGGIQDGWQGGN